MGQSILTVDAFADSAYSGNPAAVCVLESQRDADWMQQIASEMNLSETCFIERSGAEFGLRWFTPAMEVDLCGHGTLASAHVLWEEGHLATDQPARFQTRSGLLTAVRTEGGIEMDFPVTPPEPVEIAPEVVEVAGCQPRYVGRTARDLLVVLPDATQVRNLQPDVKQIAALPSLGVIITAASDDPEFDFISRYFAPKAGIDEDPVCGSAHCTLAPYWQAKLGKDSLRAYQASARGGVVTMRVSDDRVALGGRAVTVLRGELVA